MKHRFVLPYGDARKAADFAREGEESGWDGFFVWSSGGRQGVPAVLDRL
jgi:hypothetical protein